MPIAVNKAKAKNNHPPQNATKRSEIFFEIKLPPITAMNVANKCPAVAPMATPTGFCAAPKAIVANIDLSPHSATKIKQNVSMMF